MVKEKMQAEEFQAAVSGHGSEIFWHQKSSFRMYDLYIVC